MGHGSGGGGDGSFCATFVARHLARSQREDIRFIEISLLSMAVYAHATMYSIGHWYF